MEKVFSKEDIIKDLKAIGVKEGDLLHLKVSMKSVGPLENGVITLLDAILDSVGPEGTIVADAFIPFFQLPLSEEDTKKIPHDKTPSYAGAFANAMIKHPMMHRSKHPIQKFVAIGKQAEELCNNHTPTSGGYDLLDDMIKQKAVNLTIGAGVVGVGTTHVAIDHLGFKRREVNKGINYQSASGEIKLAEVNWNGGCGRGFPKFYPEYREKGGIIKEGKIGMAQSVFTSMAETYIIEINRLKNDPSFFFCDNPACYSCRMTWEHSERNYIKFGYHWLRERKGKMNLSHIKLLFGIK
ncbi:MAG: AAC(3) family N-acetyltransferase [Bacteroidales bacterium]|nr:AAC(3) family N-acetyltransferase [Bacteroidales bacterium]